MRPTHRGVLVPDELLNASEPELDAYAAKVREGNGRVVSLILRVEDELERRGIDPEDRV